MMLPDNSQRISLKKLKQELTRIDNKYNKAPVCLEKLYEVDIEGALKKHRMLDLEIQKRSISEI